MILFRRILFAYCLLLTLILLGNSFLEIFSHAETRKIVYVWFASLVLLIILLPFERKPNEY